MPMIHASYVFDRRGLKPDDERVEVENVKEVVVPEVALGGVAVAKVCGIDMGFWKTLVQAVAWASMWSIAALVILAVGCLFELVVRTAFYPLLSYEYLRSLFYVNELALKVAKVVFKFVGTPNLVFGLMQLATLSFTSTCAIDVFANTVLIQSEVRWFLLATSVGLAYGTAAADVFASGSWLLLPFFGFDGFIAGSFVAPALYFWINPILGHNGYCMSVLIYGGFVLVSPTMALTGLAMVYLAQACYVRQSVQQPGEVVRGFQNQSIERETNVVLAQCLQRLRLGFPGDFEKYISWKTLVAYVEHGGAEIESPEVRRYALIGDRALASTVAALMEKYDWTVATESCINQRLLSNSALGMVAQRCLGDLFPMLQLRNEKRKGTLIEAIVGVAFVVNKRDVEFLMPLVQEVLGKVVSVPEGVAGFE